MWILWMLVGQVMAQDTCAVAEETARRYKPRAAEASWEDPGGWSGKRLRGMAKERKANFKKYKRQFASYSADAQLDILNGVLREDLDEVATWLAWGSPSWTWKDTDKACRHLLYANSGDTDVVLSTCDGATQGLFELGAPMSCARLDAVVPRITKKSKRTKDWSTEQMVAALVGAPREWMARDDLELVFGKPDRKRDKGNTLVFLDDDGLHEGPTVMLANGLADSWTFPARQLLTRSGERAIRREGRGEGGGGGQGAGKVFQLLKAAAAVGLVIAEEQGSLPTETTHTQTSYRNEVRLECNGSVLYDKVFTERAACLEAERTTHFECVGLVMPFGC